jgi:hypothetical protein
LIGKAVEADLISYFTKKIETSNSAMELMDIYRIYHNHPNANLALSRAKQIDPNYVTSALPAANAEVAAITRIMESDTPEDKRSEAVAQEVQDWQQELLNQKFDIQLTSNSLAPEENERTQSGPHQYWLHYQAMQQEIDINSSIKGVPNNGIVYPCTIKVRYLLSIPVTNISRKMMFGLDLHLDDIETKETIREYTLKSGSDVARDSVSFKIDVAMSATVLTLQQDQVLNGDPELSVDIIEIKDSK